MTTICTEIIRGLFTLVSVAAGAYVALKLYFRQKEYELVKMRYLEGAVDILAAELEATLGTLSHNWSRCLQICKSFRDTDSHFDLAELKSGFRELDSSNFHEIAQHRLSSLVGADVLWDAYQAAMAHANSANNMFTREIPEAIRLRLTTTLMCLPAKDMAEQMMHDLKKKHDAGLKFAGLIRALYGIGLILESEKLRLKAVAQFASRPDVKQLMQSVVAEIPIELDQEGQSEQP